MAGEAGVRGGRGEGRQPGARRGRGERETARCQGRQGFVEQQEGGCLQGEVPSVIKRSHM